MDIVDVLKLKLQNAFAKLGKQVELNDLIIEKLVEYIPAMLFTNLSTLMMVSLDGIVAGNFIGQDALSSVHIFYPVTLILSIIANFLLSSTLTLISSVE